MRNEYKGHRFENINKLNFSGVGQYGIPAIIPQEQVTNYWIPFNYSSRYSLERRADTGVHFFVDDYQFARVWNYPDIYLKSMRSYGCACSPDFSLYRDMPVALQIYNHFRKHWLGAYWQLHGISVIPSISWSTPDSYAWCFDGEPTQATVAVSSVGCLKQAESKRLFSMGYTEMVKRLQPKQVMLYGQLPADCEHLAQVTTIPPFYGKFKQESIAHGR